MNLIAFMVKDNEFFHQNTNILNELINSTYLHMVMVLKFSTYNSYLFVLLRLNR